MKDFLETSSAGTSRWIFFSIVILKRPRKQRKRKLLQLLILQNITCLQKEWPKMTVLRRQEAAEPRAEANQEFELEQRELKKKRRPTKSYADDDNLGSLFSGGITGKLPKLANRITLKNVSPGMKVWGIIVEVNQKDLVISLPGGLRGFVRAEEASDILSHNGMKDIRSDLLCRVFHIGQLMSCIVLHFDDDKKDKKGRKRILLSLRLALLHKGLMLDAIQEGIYGPACTCNIKMDTDNRLKLEFKSLASEI